MKTYDTVCKSLIDLSLKIEHQLKTIQENEYKLISITSTTLGDGTFNLTISYLEK